VIINLIIGSLIAPDYGRTPDEEVESLRASAALGAYAPGSLGQYSDNEIPPASRFYGTAMTMLAQLAENVFQPIIDSDNGVIIHFSYYIFFQIGIISIFFLSNKFVSEWIALVTAILFATQPLYFGHSFINPKDLPLLSIFLAAVTIGLHMADNLVKKFKVPDKIQSPRNKFSFSNAWSRTPQKTRRVMFAIHFIWPTLLALFWIVKSNIPKLVEIFYYSPKDSFLGNIFNLSIIQSPLADISPYINKAYHLNQSLFQITAGAIGVFVLLLYLRKVPGLWEHLWNHWLAPVLNDFRLKNIIQLITNLNILAAGFLWGWCISTRVVGIFVGGMIGLYLVLRIGKRAIAPLFIYSAISFTTTFLSFPQLWTNGFSKLSKGLTLFSAFFWDRNVVFNGTIYTASELPRGYLPFFLAAQFTEPVMILAGIGLIIGLRKSLIKTINWKLLLVITAWILLPLSYVLLKHPNLYNNSRQFLFITPPLFILAGIGLEKVLSKLNISITKVLVVCAVLLPGVVALFQLHPYQYIYYNQFVGGVHSAFRNYEIDYWATSSAEATKYLNQIAPENSKIIVWIYPSIVEFYAREDLVIISQKDVTQNISYYDFAIINSQFDADILNLQSSPSLYTIERNGAILAVVKAIDD
jgi:hypothetical protein